MTNIPTILLLNSGCGCEEHRLQTVNVSTQQQCSRMKRKIISASSYLTKCLSDHQTVYETPSHLTILTLVSMEIGRAHV